MIKFISEHSTKEGEVANDMDEFLKTMKGALQEESSFKKQRTHDGTKRNAEVTVEHIRCSTRSHTEEKISKRTPSSS
ncbi:MAG: hypothetical protein U1D31_00990 [Patescibacteria group bacterium]|nr:hypothetical protein [bacterium]MDZ4240696.1 hypothetical protein [Patescibacteria group bacterium]